MGSTVRTPKPWDTCICLKIIIFIQAKTCKFFKETRSLQAALICLYLRLTSTHICSDRTTEFAFKQSINHIYVIFYIGWASVSKIHERKRVRLSVNTFLSNTPLYLVFMKCLWDVTNSQSYGYRFRKGWFFSPSW